MMAQINYFMKQHTNVRLYMWSVSVKVHSNSVMMKALGPLAPVWLQLCKFGEADFLMRVCSTIELLLKTNICTLLLYRNKILTWHSATKPSDNFQFHMGPGTGSGLERIPFSQTSCGHSVFVQLRGKFVSCSLLVFNFISLSFAYSCVINKQSHFSQFCPPYS